MTETTSDEPKHREYAALLAALEKDCERVPFLLRESFALYRVYGIQPGSFLRAVIRNNLYEAVILADPQSRECLWHIVQMVHWYDGHN